MYGLKQAPRQWNAKLSEALLKFGFMQSQHDHSLFINETCKNTIVILVYVDDMLLTGPDLILLKEVKAKLQQDFKMKDLGELKYFLCIKFARSQQVILMHQKKYTLELIYELGLGAAKTAVTPIEANIKLTTKEYDEHTGIHNTTDNELLPVARKYQRLLGKLLYLTVTRPYIAFSVQTLSQFMQKSKRSHIEVAQRVIRYVKNQPGQGILLSTKKKNIITTYCDADWAACPLTRKSVTGFFIMCGDSLVSGKSKKQSTISRISAESEYKSIASTLAELVWILGLFKDIEVSIALPVNIHTDSKAAIQIVANLVFHERTKHIEIDCHFVRKKIQMAGEDIVCGH
ncbi:PREDICTED: uncharacterized protein LOC109225035 [Nicotiana attenuata]|uniref:uncharacterized protein LOC109225035 n=1 Tax=Nicotiana attenuata TaxID=49451 RepID=UPI0009051FF5|nr:PREDICTED: uncharacterized protein LOC109225035 [Nicotiana attenuata]